MPARTIVIGDVHGCADELDALVRACDYDPRADSLVLVGDLVAKGPDSKGVLDRVAEWGARAVCGNHDATVLRYRPEAPVVEGRERPAHRAVAATLGPQHWALLASLPLWLHTDDGALVVHGGIVPGVPLPEQDPHLLMNIRTLDAHGAGSPRPDGGPLWGSRYTGPELVIFGHHAQAGLQRHSHALGLDTGCVYGGALTACLLPEQRVVSVPARHTYAPAGAEAPAR